MGEPFVSNVLSYKYDTALDFHVTMYDHLPYQRDSDYCNVEKITLVSGRVIKFYLCYNQPEVFSINNKDDVIDEILAQAKINERQYAMEKRVRLAKQPGDSQNGQDGIQTLLNDNGNSLAEFEEEDELAAPEGAVNAFEGVEDW